MCRDRFYRRRSLARDGFTFAEMLLVLAILLIITGVVFPPVLRMMADQPLKEAAERAGGTVLDVTSHKFTPQGVTALALLSESHISIHTWPEHGYSAVDVFTCGSHTNPQLACDFLKKSLECTGESVKVLERGTAVG